MSTLTAIAPAVKSSRIFGEGILPITRAEKLAASSAWLAAREREHEMEARVAGVGPRQIDAAWKLGLDLGREGIEAFAPEAMTFVERRAFRRGQAEGAADFEAVLDSMATAAGIDWSRIEESERAEAGMSPPAFAFA